MNIFKRYLASVVVIALGAAQAMAQMVVPAAVTPFGGGGGSVSSGSAISGCTINSIVYIDASGNLACASTPVNGSVSTAGRSILTISDTISGSSATSNFLNITGAFPATLSAATNGLYFTFALDNDAQVQQGMQLNVTGTGPTAAAAYGLVVNNSASGSTGVGVYGTNSGSQTVRYGGLFTFAGANPSATSAALAANNGNVAADIFRLEDNGTAVFTIADGGAVTATQDVTVSTNKFLFVGGGLGGLATYTIQTPDNLILATGAAANSAHLMENADAAVFDFNNGACGTSACTDPGLIIHSAAQDTTQYNHQAAWGQAGGALKTLTESAATSVVRIPVAALEGTGGKLTYRVKAADATDVQIREGEIKFAVVNKAGTETCTLSGASEAADGSVVAASVGTLTYGITCDTTPANAVDIRFNAVSSLTQTTLNIQYFITLTGVGQPARQ